MITSYCYCHHEWEARIPTSKHDITDSYTKKHAAKGERNSSWLAASLYPRFLDGVSDVAVIRKLYNYYHETR